MLQQIIALIIIIYFLARLFWQKKRGKIFINEFIFWFSFWFLSGLAIIFLKQIDRLVAILGFSGSGIEVLLYLGVVVLFYFIFRLRLRLAKIEKNLTKITRNLALQLKDKNNDKT